MLMTGRPMLRYQDVAHNKARVRSLTTLEPNEFADLVPDFERCFMDRMREYTIDGLPRLNRRYTSYQNSPLPTIEDKLLFILVHMKQNLTQDVQGQLFGMGQSDANKWLQLLRPVLHQALQQVGVVPARLATIMTAPDEPTSDSSPFFIMMARNVPSNDL
jgi:hypothetical protein